MFRGSCSSRESGPRGPSEMRLGDRKAPGNGGPGWLILRLENMHIRGPRSRRLCALPSCSLLDEEEYSDGQIHRGEYGIFRDSRATIAKEFIPSGSERWLGRKPETGEQPAGLSCRRNFRNRLRPTSRGAMNFRVASGSPHFPRRAFQ